VLAATRLRRDTDAAWRRLTWFGARRWQLVTLTAAESGAIALAGAIAGAFEQGIDQLGRQARENVERNFTWERCGRATIEAYEAALQ